MPEPTAQESIAKEWADRAEQFRELFERIDRAPDTRQGAHEAEEAEEELQELPLGVSTYKLVRIDLSTGGPGDWLEAEYLDDSDQPAHGRLQRITYHFAPWLDHAEMDVTNDENAERFVEFFNPDSY